MPSNEKGPISLNQIVMETVKVCDQLSDQIALERDSDAPDEARIAELRKGLQALEGVTQVVTALCLSADTASSLAMGGGTGGGGSGGGE